MRSLGSAFNRLWSAAIATNFADGLLGAATPLLAVTLTRNPVAISLLGALGTLPWLLFAAVLGGVTDRVNRRVLLAGANSVRFLIAGSVGLLIHNNSMTLWWLYLAAFSWGICEVVADTTSSALIPQMLEPSQLETANSRLNIAETVIQSFVGVPISSYLFAIAAALPFLFGSTGFVLAAVAIFSLPHSVTGKPERAAETAHHSFLDDLKFGVRYLWNHKEMRHLVISTAAIGFWFNAASSTFVLFAIDELGVPAKNFGPLLTVLGLGGLAGAALAPRISKRVGRGKAMAAAIVLESITIVGQGLSPNLATFILVSILGGFVISIWNVLLMACYQVLIPSELYGRIHGARRTLVWGIGPFGAVLGGYVANFGLRWPLILGGAVSTVLALRNARFFHSVANSTVAA